MKKAFVAILAAGAIAAAAATASAPAQAGNNTGAVVAAGVGGLALGAIIGANAQPVVVAPAPVVVYPAYRTAPGYVVYTGYRARVPVACPGGFWGRKPVAFDRAGRPVAWSKPRYFCP